MFQDSISGSPPPGLYVGFVMLWLNLWLQFNRRAIGSNVISFQICFWDAITKLSHWINQVSQAMRKCVLCHMRTTKAQISLRIRAVWSAPLLFAA